MTESALSDWTKASAAIRKAADTERVNARLAEHLETLDAYAWENLSTELEVGADTDEDCAGKVSAFANAAGEVRDRAESGLLDVGEDMLEHTDALANLDADVFDVIAERLETRSATSRDRSEATGAFADAVRAAEEALAELAEVEPSERDDVREQIMDALGQLIEAEDRLFEVFDSDDS